MTVRIDKQLTEDLASRRSAGLKQTCPPGVFVSLTPGDPSLWSGVIFVRKGKVLLPSATRAPL